jgi:predicted pyridoxine 5'-phosphate oxidase superfamily flavin-nucleotide-binding protein
VTGPFHAGELAVQRRAGVADVAERVGRGNLLTALPEEFAAFLAGRYFLVAGTPGPDGRIWASVLFGPPGFAAPLDARTVLIRTVAAPGDPLREAVVAGPVPVGLLAIDQSTRVRIRLNGTAELSTDGLRVTLAEVFGNCPKYIGLRVPTGVVDGEIEHHAGTHTALTGDHRALLARTDTAFVASSNPDHGVDASHKGGRPGFLEADPDGRRLLLPDYAGNMMFQTLGNLTIDPRIGVLVIDWDSGRTLQIAGRATILWDGPEVEARPRAQRVVEIAVEAVIDRAVGFPVRFDLREAHRLNPPLRHEPDVS